MSKELLFAVGTKVRLVRMISAPGSNDTVVLQKGEEGIVLSGGLLGCRKGPYYEVEFKSLSQPVVCPEEELERVLLPEYDGKPSTPIFLRELKRVTEDPNLEEVPAQQTPLEKGDIVKLLRNGYPDDDTEDPVPAGTEVTVVGLVKGQSTEYLLECTERAVTFEMPREHLGLVQSDDPLSRVIEPAPAEIEELVIEKIRQRRDAGRKKYGTSMERTDLSHLQWLVHAQEEAMDFAIYLEKLIRLEGQRQVAFEKTAELLQFGKL